MVSLNFDLTFKELHCPSGLRRLDGVFLSYLHEADADLHTKLLLYRKGACTEIARQEYSEFLIDLSYILDDFISELFCISKENLELKKTNSNFDKIYECRRKFIQRYALKKYTKEKLQGDDFQQISEYLTKRRRLFSQEPFSTPTWRSWWHSTFQNKPA